MKQRKLARLKVQDLAFLLLVVFVSWGMAKLLAPYFGAVLWGIVAAILFAPLARRAERNLDGRKNLAALLVLLVLIAAFIIPAIVLGFNLVSEATSLYTKIESHQIDFGHMLHQVRDALPSPVRGLVDRYGVGDIDTLRQRFGASIASGLQGVASRLLAVGQSALSFIAALGVMLYLTFFLLRDGEYYGALVRKAIPLRAHLRDRLIDHFLVVVRATMKGTVVVAIAQGLAGGIIFSLLGVEAALLWGVLMGFFSLLPAVGTAIVWVPVAGYLLATGAIWQGAVMIFCGLFVIGLIDNLLRPILVGRDTRMPDFVVLIATLSGIELFGLTGFVIGPVIAALFISVWSLVIEEGEEDPGNPADETDLAVPEAPPAMPIAEVESRTESAAHPS